MSRWPENTRERLVRSAYERFAQVGFQATTVDEIAAGAGVTQRTFFRHFINKEEVLFADDERYVAIISANVPAPADQDVLTAAIAQIRTLAHTVSEDPELHTKRARIVQDSEALHARHLLKLEQLRTALLLALIAAGHDPGQAQLAVGYAWLAVDTAYDDWVRSGGAGTLPERFAERLAQLQSLTCR